MNREKARALNDRAVIMYTRNKASIRPVPYDSVMRLFSESIRADSSFRPAWMNRANVYIDTHNYEALEQTMELWVSKNPSDAQARKLLADVYANRGNSERANVEYDKILDQYRRELEVHADSIDLNAVFATVLAARYDKQRALAYMDSVREEHPEATRLAATECLIEKNIVSVLDRRDAGASCYTDGVY